MTVAEAVTVAVDADADVAVAFAVDVVAAVTFAVDVAPAVAVAVIVAVAASWPQPWLWPWPWTWTRTWLRLPAVDVDVDVDAARLLQRMWLHRAALPSPRRPRRAALGHLDTFPGPTSLLNPVPRWFLAMLLFMEGSCRNASSAVTNAGIEAHVVTESLLTGRKYGDNSC